MRYRDFLDTARLAVFGVFGALLGLGVGLLFLVVVCGDLRDFNSLVPASVLLPSTAAGAYLTCKRLVTVSERHEQADRAKEEFFNRAWDAIRQSNEVPDRAPDEAGPDDRFKPGDPTDIRP